ncbi:MAG: transporter substrate-binding domain-containing protein [Alphaproteobacteria bacterium]|nr:transporter substrate-binding domain-containing protein [Alphaproteobacteria bacterium]
MAAIAQDLPPVPDAIKKQGVVRVGIKCDYPPDGYLDNAGKPQGIEVSLAKQLAVYAFGSAEKAELTCVTAANRIPALQGGKIDAIIATLGISEERLKVIDFSDKYAWGASEVVVAENSPIKKLRDLGGKTVVVLKGAWQIGWFEKNLPDANLLKLDSVSDALQALMQGRADGYAHDLAVLQELAKKNKKVKLVGDLYQVGYRGIGLRKDEPQWVAFVNASIAKANKDGLVAKWVKEYVEADTQDIVLNMWSLDKVPTTTN